MSENQSVAPPTKGVPQTTAYHRQAGEPPLPQLYAKRITNRQRPTS